MPHDHHAFDDQYQLRMDVILYAPDATVGECCAIYALLCEAEAIEHRALIKGRWLPPRVLPWHDSTLN